MNNKKSTKRALLSSVLSLVLCMAMLIGTTFAWFTDSVSSTNNIIKSGNLDVELEYYNGDSWEKVTANTNVFEENTLWEPGHTEVVYLKVSNLGTLALKYQLGINIVNEVESINVAGEALRLSDYIEFGAIEGVSTPYADRAAARAAVTNSAILSTGYTKAGSIEAGAVEQYVALVVYMPETVGNEANYRTGEVAPQIDLGINLMATQYTSESDSFNNQYDADAKFGGAPAARTTVLAKMPTVGTLGGNTVTLDTGYVFNTTETYDQAQMNAYRYWHADFVAFFDQDVDDAAIGLAGQYDTYSPDWLAFELDGVGDIAANTPVRMLEFAGISMNYEELCLAVKEFSCGAFAVDQAAMAGKTMTVELRLYETTIDPNATSGSANEETGEYITIGTYSYTFGAKKVADAATLADAIAKGGDIILDADVDLGEANITVPADKAVVLDLNGNTITTKNTTAAASSAIANKGELTIKNGTVTYKGVGDPNFGYGTNTINNTGKLVIDGATVINTTNSGSSVAIDCSAGAELIINSGKVVSQKNAIRLCPFGSAAINCTINGGTITGARAVQIQLPSNKPADAPDVNLTVNGGVLNGTGGLSIYSYSYGQSFANVDVTITGGTFNNDVAFGGGNAKATTENVTITGGTFKGELGRYLANDGWEDIAKP